MKKTIIALILSIFSFTFIACDEKQEETINLEKYLSTYQSCLYVSQDENFNIYITTITQESPFLADGLIGEMKMESSINLKPKTGELLNHSYEYYLIGSNGQINGNLQKNKLGIAFKDTIKDLDSLGDIQKVTIKYSENEVSFMLSNVLENAIDYSKALELSYNHFKETVDLELANNSFNREIYIKLINNESENNYCYYISFLKTYKDFYSCTISLNGEYLNENISTKQENSN